MTLTQPLQGIVVPVITPVDRNGAVEEQALRAVLRRCIDGGVHGLFVGGTSGIGPLLTDREWRRMLEIALDEVGEERPLLAGVMETSTPRAVERIRTLEKLGYRAYVVTATYYIPISQPESFLRHFGACREASALEMIIYNIPPCTGSVIPADTLLEMARRGWLRYVKDSSNDHTYFADLCARGSQVGLGVFQGNKPDFAALLAQGAAGSVPTPANVAPAPFAAAWNAVRAGDKATIARLQPQINTLWDTLVSGFDFLSGGIYALHKLGIGSGGVIPPLLEAGEERRRAIDALDV